MDTGFFQLNSPTDLLEKLQWEYKNLVAHPGNAYHAFNFFVTAEHMADWMNCLSLKKTDPLLALCSHIANGGKHFEVKDPKHKSVVSAKHDSVFEFGIFEEGVFEESLQITLELETAKALGMTTIDAVSLASKVLEFWKTRVKRD